MNKIKNETSKNRKSETANPLLDAGGSPSGINPYMYVSGNPIKYNDPTGHKQKAWQRNMIKSMYSAVIQHIQEHGSTEQKLLAGAYLKHQKDEYNDKLDKKIAQKLIGAVVAVIVGVVIAIATGGTGVPAYLQFIGSVASSTLIGYGIGTGVGYSLGTMGGKESALAGAELGGKIGAAIGFQKVLDLGFDKITQTAIKNKDFVTAGEYIDLKKFWLGEPFNDGLAGKLLNKGYVFF